MDEMIYEVTLESLYYDQQVINRWNYLSTGSVVGITGAGALLTALGAIDVAGVFDATTLFGRMQDLQSPAVTYVSVLAKAIREAPTDFYDYGYPAGTIGQGGGTGDMSPTAAFGFRSNRTRTDISRGTKRLVGVQESNVDAGGIFNSGTLGAMDLIADEMSEVLSYTTGGSSVTFAPIVVQKEKIELEPDHFTYRYYETIAEQLEHIAIGITWQSYQQVRTQVSRQYGHGS
jgi:hypothetical protein